MDKGRNKVFLIWIEYDPQWNEHVQSSICLRAKVIRTAKIHTRTTWKGSYNQSLADAKKSSHNGEH